MKTLTVRREIRFPGFGIWKWKKSDYGTPLALNTPNGKALIFVEEDKFAMHDLTVFSRGHIELLFTPPPGNLLRGLKSKGQLAQDAARIIFDNYADAYQQFQALLMSAGGVRMLGPMPREAMHDFFNTHATLLGRGVEWKVDEEEYQQFTVKIPRGRGRHPLYTARQLVTPSRWEKIQRAANDSDIPNDELLELYMIRSKAEWRELRVAAIEASIISETLLREYALKILKSEGFSNTKIKRLKDELTFNNLLNIILPLSLNKTELRQLSSSIQAIDTLRAIRNGLVHGTATLEDIDDGDVGRGIDGAIKLVGFLKAKLQNT